MASETLSQNEIDALLGGGGRAATATSIPVVRDLQTEAQVYDFRRPHRISKERLRTLEAMYERCAKSLEGWLLGRVRGGVQLQLQSVEQFSFGEFTLSLPTPCASFTFELNGSGGQQGVLDFGHEFAYFLIDRLFGGSGTPALPNRAMTPIERMAVRMVADRVLTGVKEVWQDYIELDLEISGFESIPEILRVANREDPVLVANIEVTAADTRSLLLICLPFAVLERFFAGGTERRETVVGTPDERIVNRDIAEHSVRGTRIPVSARLPSFQLSMRELLGLSTGSILSTGVPRNAELDVIVGSQSRFRAAPGRIGPSLAVRLTDGLLPAPETDSLPITRTTTS
ncbi:MAG: FliM/FliN family flagellar motor switch protein [Gemmatimonadetes bacterium]|nr:FliM/FliN family flagellar motor switch protein [Gemmatimonadota bacterium]MCC6773803.1 FliM/FliN family flagellar motor switch protein [Gemmatimonadaceae bacterium]